MPTRRLAKRCISSKVKTRIGLGFHFRSRVVGPDADALGGVEAADFIRDRVLGHRREGAEDADGPIIARPSVLSMWSTRARV